MSYYKVVRIKDIQAFNREVCELIDNGWRCVGGICFANNNYMQAMMFEGVD